MQALRVRELRTVPGFEWTRVTQRKVPAKAVLVNVNLKTKQNFLKVLQPRSRSWEIDLSSFLRLHTEVITPMYVTVLGLMLFE